MEALERLPGETVNAWETFTRYAAMGPTRSIAKLAAVLPRDKRWLERLSSRWHWSERAERFDAAMAPHLACVLEEAVASARQGGKA